MSKVAQVGINNWKKSQQARWLTCHACAQVTAGRVGSEWKQGSMTQEEYGKKLGVSRQQVSRLTGAWKMYAQLRAAWLAGLHTIYPHPFEIRMADTTTTEHFTELWECRNKYGLNDAQLFDILCWAWDGAVNAEVMRAFVDDAYDGKSAIPEWYTHGSQVMNLLGKLQNDYGAPEEVQVLAALTYEALREWMQQGAT